jgi:hypothetical protein
VTEATDSIAEFYNLDRAVSANFVMSCSGLFVDGQGSSRGISNETDRRHLVRLRRQADALVTGGQTAKIENYAPSSNHETYVFSKNPVRDGLEQLHFTNQEGLIQAVCALKMNHTRVLVEAGPGLLRHMFRANLVQSLFLSITHDAENCKCTARQISGCLPNQAAVKLLTLPRETIRRAVTISGTCLSRLDFGEPDPCN